MGPGRARDTRHQTAAAQNITAEAGRTEIRTRSKRIRTRSRYVIWSSSAPKSYHEKFKLSPRWALFFRGGHFSREVKTFLEEAYEIAFGDEAINRDFSPEEVIEELQSFSDKALKYDEGEY